MSAQSFLLAEPWGLNIAIPGDRQPVGEVVDAPLTVRGESNPRLVCPIDAERPWCGPRRQKLPPASFPFRWLGGDMQAYALPLGAARGGGLHETVQPLGVGRASHLLHQTSVVGRPYATKAHPLSERVSAWINWQVHCFQELARRDEEENGGSRGGAFRRSWTAARQVWIEAQQEEARRALIVELAESRELRDFLAELARSPRRVLERYRTGTRLDRIQELDAACLRDFARRPGRTSAEKAGSRQELLAVRRRESYDTLENRVTAWVLDSSADLARDYVQANRRAVSDRVRVVRRFGHAAHEWRQTERMEAIGTDQLTHPVAPNYPLQMDRRYQRVYQVYKKILREHRVLDDAWDWQRVLWGETGRQLLSCALLSRYDEPLRSTPYYRPEALSGRWLFPPASPGPLETPRGTCHVFDCHDLSESDPRQRSRWCAHPPFPAAAYVGAVGCDQFLYWPDSRLLVPVWHHYTLEPWSRSSAIVERVAEAIRLLSEDLRRVAEKTTVRGIVLISDVNRTDETGGLVKARWPVGGTPVVVALGLPIDVHRFAGDLAGSLREVVEEVGGSP